MRCRSSARRPTRPTTPGCGRSSFGLEATGFTAQAAAVGARWKELLSHHDTKPEPEYHRCYPDDLLRKVTDHALSGVRAIGCRLAGPASTDPIHAALNRAWDEFWAAPESFPEWEKAAVNALF